MPSGLPPSLGAVRSFRQTTCGLTLLAALGAWVVVAAPASATLATKPHALKLLINGKQLPITPFAGPDRYNPIKASKLRVEARWKGSLNHTGYKVVITTTEPHARTWRTCSTGTSCLVGTRVPIQNGEEMSWTVRIMKIQPHLKQILAGFMVCLVRHATPT
jgi:hypothetical protein